MVSKILISSPFIQNACVEWVEPDGAHLLEHKTFSLYVSIKEENLQTFLLSSWHTANEECLGYLKKKY
jgi:hypothetical protein